jgi:hypothetical protein
MSRFILSAALGLSLAIPGAALAQSAGGAGSGMDSNNRSMSGANLNVDNGINANGTPKQQSPGVSMSNGPASSGTLNGDGIASPGGPAGVGTPAPVGGPGGGLGMGGSSGGTASATSGGDTGK